MRRHIGAVGATLTAAGLIFATPSLVARAATAQTTQANAALRYLYSQVGTDGGVAPAFGPGATEDTVISVADNGFDPATLKSPTTGTTTYGYLSSHASAITTAGGAAKYVLTWLAAGKPSAIDGSAQLTKLNTPTASGGYLHPNGAFHAAEKANAYAQSLAVIADLAAGVPLPPHAIGWLTCAQRADGGFGSLIVDTATAPPASCGDASSDSNNTAIVLQALGRAGAATANSKALTYLHSLQDADGGFQFNPGSGSDPGSDTVVIQALLAIGQDPTGAPWTVAGGGNALSNMESYADPQSGGYVFPGNTAPDAFTTSAIPQALALEPYGAKTTVVAGSSPPPPPRATASPSPTGSVQGVTVPATGSASDVGGPWTWALALLSLGAAALAWSGIRGRSPTIP